MLKLEELIDREIYYCELKDHGNDKWIFQYRKDDDNILTNHYACLSDTTDYYSHNNGRIISDNSYVSVLRNATTKERDILINTILKNGDEYIPRINYTEQQKLTIKSYIFTIKDTIEKLEKEFPEILK